MHPQAAAPPSSKHSNNGNGNGNNNGKDAYNPPANSSLSSFEEEARGANSGWVGGGVEFVQVGWKLSMPFYGSYHVFSVSAVEGMGWLIGDNANQLPGQLRNCRPIWGVSVSAGCIS